MPYHKAKQYIKCIPKSCFSITRGLRLAIQQAVNSDNEKFRLGAVIFKGGRIISKGNNVSKRSPDIIRFSLSCGIHAEMAALNKHKYAREKVADATIFVVRINKSGHLSMAKPCDECCKHLRKANIRQAIYTVSDNEFGILIL